MNERSFTVKSGAKSRGKKDQLPRLSRAVSNAFPPENIYLVGVSGGRDSVVLLRLLVAAGYRDLCVCHLNHRLRGRESTADARFVEALAGEFDLDCEIGETNVRELARQNKRSIETAARVARYGFFADVARRRGCSTIFLGHHADDVVETFLINLFRGTGRTGLVGMRETAKHRLAGVELTVVRPLLSVWRDEIDRFVKEHRLPFREDSTNREAEALRNRIRLRALPYLERTLGRNIKASLWRTATILGEEEALLDRMLPPPLARGAGLQVKDLQRLDAALQRRVLRQWLQGEEVADLGFEVIERVRGLLDVENGPAKTNLARDRHARRRGGKIFLE